MLTDVEKCRIRDKAKIREIMDSHMLKPEEQKAPWLVEIFTREHRKGGDIFEGARVVSACTEDNEKTYQIMIDQSSFQLKLSLIEYVVVL